jgi:hypothetical protein
MRNCGATRSLEPPVQRQCDSDIAIDARTYHAGVVNQLSGMNSMTAPQFMPHAKMRGWFPIARS